MPLALAGALLAATLAGAAPARATGAEDDSKTFFAQGRQLRLEGRCADAVVAFRRALEIYPDGLGALRNIAECEEALGSFASARRHWWDLRLAAMKSTEPKYVGWDAEAEERHRALSSRVARMTVTLEGDARDGIEVMVDGSSLDPRLVGVELERDLGEHVVSARADGAELAAERIVLEEGDNATVVLRLPPAPVAPPPPPAPVAVRPPSARPAEDAPSLRTAGFIGLGVGGVGVVGTIVSIVIRQGALASVESACPAYRTEACPASVRAERDTGVTASTLANVFGGVALAGLGAGVTLLLVGSSGTSASSPSGTKGPRRAAVELVPTLGGAAGRATLSF